MKFVARLLVVLGAAAVVAVACNVEGLVVTKSPQNLECRRANISTPHELTVETRGNERQHVCVDVATFNRYDVGSRYP